MMHTRIHKGWGLQTQTVWVSILLQRISDALQLLRISRMVTMTPRRHVLFAGENFLHVLPDFDVLILELCHLKLKGFPKANSEEVYDVFIKNHASLCRTYPAGIIIKNLTLLKVWFQCFSHICVYIYNIIYCIIYWRFTHTNYCSYYDQNECIKIIYIVMK